MAVPVSLEEVQRALRPWLGTFFLTSNAFAQSTTEKLQQYAPYKQSLESLREEMEGFCIRSINRLTGGDMRFMLDDFRTVRLTLHDLQWMTDDVMGVLFDRLTPFSMNFVRLNDYALHGESLAALRVLYQKYESFFKPEEYQFLVEMIRRTYPLERYQAWLK